MKETIYTIPINEAFDLDCSCSICAIENRIENEQIDYTLGPAMMEPDFREKTNAKGFCKHHYRELINSRKALPLSLILQTYSQQQNSDIISKKVKHKSSSGGLFKKQSEELISAQMIVEHINKTDNSCAICESVSDIMNRYINNIVYIWKTQPDFRTKFESKNGFCVPHFARLLECASKELNRNDFIEFYHTIMEMQEKSQNQMYEDISAFVRLFDHNSDKNASDEVKNAIRRTIQKYSSLNCEND